MALHVIVGKGPIGMTTAGLLAEQGHEVRVVSRSAVPPTGPSVRVPAGRSDGRVRHVVLDASDKGALTTVTRGAAALYNCANPPYHRWPVEWPPLASAMLDTAEETGAVLVIMGNLYGYGPVHRPMTEDLPLAATGSKGRVRARMWLDALARHEAGRVRAAEARASDFYGPGVAANGLLGERAVPAVLRGRPVYVLGDPDAPHTWTYVPDVARALVRLGTDERAWGRAWHVPSAPALSQRAAVQRIWRAAGVRPVPVRAYPWWLIRLAGMASPRLRELRETWHQFAGPFVLDSSAYTATFGERATLPDDAFAATVAWWRGRLGERRRPGAPEGVHA